MSIKGQNILEENSSMASNNEPKFSGELYVKNVHKSFGVTKALNDVCFTGYFGEIHAVIGGNGSGKSTLAKVLAGVLPIDSGKVSVNGEHPSTPKESRDLGLAMVFQEVLVSDESSVVDNLFIGTDGFFTKTMSDNEKQNKARALMSELADEEIDPLAPAGNLPLSTKAWITITRALLSEPKVLILDESSAALDFDSTERLFKKMRELRDKGTAIIIVSHRIAELVRISDRCTVMRDGKDVGVLEKQDINEEQVRLDVHLSYFIETMRADAPNGKKLGFIGQEIGREINTIGSKSSDAEMQKIVVEMKDELEKIKEQLLNIL